VGTDIAELDNDWNWIARVDIARHDNAAPDMCIKVFQKTKKVQQLLPQFTSTW